MVSIIASSIGPPVHPMQNSPIPFPTYRERKPGRLLQIALRPSFFG